MYNGHLYTSIYWIYCREYSSFVFFCLSSFSHLFPINLDREPRSSLQFYHSWSPVLFPSLSSSIRIVFFDLSRLISSFFVVRLSLFYLLRIVLFSVGKSSNSRAFACDRKIRINLNTNTVLTNHFSAYVRPH